MTREADVVRSLVNLADTLVADFDVVELLTRLTDQCVHVLGAAAAGVMLINSSGDLRLVASSSEAMRVLEMFELQTQEGPCLDAFRTGARIEHENLPGGRSLAAVLYRRGRGGLHIGIRVAIAIAGHDHRCP